MPAFEYAWTRTRILAQAKQRARQVAHLLNWNIPGVEAALLNYMLLEYEPEMLAGFILDTLKGANHAPKPD